MKASDKLKCFDVEDGVEWTTICCFQHLLITSPIIKSPSRCFPPSLLNGLSTQKCNSVVKHLFKRRKEQMMLCNLQTGCNSVEFRDT